MLDKSVPYAGFFMVRKAGTPIPEFKLPDGYEFVLYQDGDEVFWAEIETAVLEFDNEFAALMCFTESFKSDYPDLRKRLLFIENTKGEKVATGNAWFSYVRGERRAWLHWIAVLPDYQGLGLGKAIISKVTQLMADLEGDVDIFLKTQTWSYKAVEVYKSCGYVTTDEKDLYKNRRCNYKKAMKILGKIK